jgi:hypothetical protein
MSPINIEEINIFAKKFIESISKEQWIEVSKSDIENADGRKNKFNEISQNASVIYIAYEEKNVLYVGESSKSIKRRFISDGSGSHKKKNNYWYKKMTHVKFLNYEECNLPEMYRKLLEQLFSVYFKPKNYSKKPNKTLERNSLP